MKKKIPKWLDQKNKICHDEVLEFIGETGVAGVVDGKLPNGEVYEWKKQHTRRLKKPKG